MPNHFEQQDRQGNSFMLGLMAGTAIGAGIALLLAPREGAVMRRELADGAHKIGEQLSHGTETVRQTARQVADKTTELLDRGRSAYREASGEARQAADDVSEGVRDAATDATQSARRAARQTAAAVEDAAVKVQRQV